MKLWFSACIVIIGFSCFEADNMPSKKRCKMNVYAKKFRVGYENHFRRATVNTIFFDAETETKDNVINVGRIYNYQPPPHESELCKEDFGEESSENEVDLHYKSFPGAYSGSSSGGIPDLDQDEYDDQDCSIHDKIILGGSSNSAYNPNGFTDCQPSQPIECDPNYRYRTMNGTCNNLLHPLWGARNQCFRRYYQARYTESVVDSLTDGGKAFVFPTTYNDSNLHLVLSLSAVYFSMVSDSGPGQNVSCTFKREQTELNDSLVETIGARFGDFRKSVTGASLPQPRQLSLNIFQNRHRPTEDLTFMFTIYGQTVAHDISLSDFERLPDGASGNCCTQGNENDTACINIQVSADDPFYYQFGVTCLNMFRTLACTACNTNKRQQISGQTAAMDASIVYGPDDNVARELRTNDGTGWRINIAQIQYINYEEYLPNLLGQYYMSEFDLWVQRGSGGTRYNPFVEYGVWNEFSTVAFRLHSMIATDVGALNLQFRNLYSNPALLWQGHLGEILNGVCTVPSEKYDRYDVYDITDFLFQRSGSPYGSDLASLDIQRGRDHGIAPYVYYIYNCSGGDVTIQSFDDLAYNGIISQDDVALLKENYTNVQDVDLYVGLQLEYHSRGAKVGPTAACIIARQFYTLKYGDRFYFEHTGEAGSFTAAQRSSIKQTSLSRLLCDNTYISKVQLNSMLLSSQSNPQVSCNDIPRMDLSLWKES
ncbi:unnamed protein product [Larinioides sclopetarius]|uniref:Peroxidase n=1 Tax=Larinioides sclopetarius TaxID=280406 RepID=A0AAV2AY00_9ARAC